jgi:hypothetical protein
MGERGIYADAGNGRVVHSESRANAKRALVTDSRYAREIVP